jgi:hypothetical protein
VIIHTKVDDTETHHRQIVPKIMEAVERRSPSPTHEAHVSLYVHLN